MEPLLPDHNHSKRPHMLVAVESQSSSHSAGDSWLSSWYYMFHEEYDCNTPEAITGSELCPESLILVCSGGVFFGMFRALPTNKVPG